MVRYIHSGDQVEADKKQGRPAQQQPPQQAGEAAQPHRAGGDPPQDAEASAELGVISRPIAGGEESPTGLDAEPGAAGGGEDQAASGNAAAEQDTAGGGEDQAASGNAAAEQDNTSSGGGVK